MNMFTHYLHLALRSLRRNPWLAALSVLTLAIGIAASVTSLTVLHLLAGDPLPGHSQRLFVPAFDNGGPDEGNSGAGPRLTMTWTDAQALLKAGGATRQAAWYGTAMTVQPARAGLAPFLEVGMATGPDFFSMFRAPFAHGGPWSAAEEASGAAVVVLSDEFAQRLFGRTDVLGETVDLSGRSYRVVGVLSPWRPVPRLWRLAGSSAIGAVESYFLPLQHALSRELSNDGWTSCSGPRGAGFAAFLAAECNWLEYWVELEPAQVEAYRARLSAHVVEQQRLGRLRRSDRAWLKTVAERARDFGVVGEDTKLQAGLSLAFLAACLVNVVGLLAARFANRAGEVGVRRALGASRRQVMHQFLVESAVIGVLGAVLGLLLTGVGLMLMARRNDDLGAVIQLDAPMLALAVALSVGGALLAGLWPTWRASRVRPAMQLKSQ